MHTSRSTLRRAAVAIAAAAVLTGTALVGTALAGGGNVRVAGPFSVVYDVAGNPLTGVEAAVHEVVTGNGTTTVTLHLTGFDPQYAGRTFGAHVHQLACNNTTGAGDHYGHPAVTVAPPEVMLEDKEIWLDFTVNEAGNAHAKATRPWTCHAAGVARSVVVHAGPTNATTGGAGTRRGCTSVDFVG